MSEVNHSPHSINEHEAIEVRLVGVLMEFGTWTD
jgi:hypothetical protein